MLAVEHTAAIGPQSKGKHEENDTGVPTCPICLADILNLQDKAVVSSCMHAFCLHCLLRWLDYKRSCPLCKGRVSSYFYRITEQGEYNERVLPSTPPREQPPEPRGVPLLDEARSQVAPSASFRSSMMDHSFWAHPTRPEARRHRHSSGSSGGGSRTEPRPYFHRVRAMMTAPGSRASGGGAALHPTDPTAAEEEQSLLWRRHIYLQGLYALPLKPERPVASATGATTSQRRIEEWVQRELRAVLQIEDVSLLRSFVMGLAVSARLAAAWNPSPGQPVDEAAHLEAVSALRPFLNAEAAQFWHELRCFAGSPYSLSTYDRLVQYQRGPPAQGPLAPAVEAGSHAEGYTLWTARQSAAPSQAAQPGTETAAASPGQSHRDAGPQRQDPSHRSPRRASSSGRQSRWDQRPACQPEHPASSRRSWRDEVSQGSAPARPAQGKDSQDHRRKRCRDEHRCCAGGSGGRRGLCLDCAERQAAEEEQRQAGCPRMPAADPQATDAGLRATAAAARDARQPDPMLRASGQVDSAAISRLAAERLRALLGPSAPSTSAADSLPASSTPASELVPALLPSESRPTETQSRSSQNMADLGVIDLCSDSDDEVVLVTATMQPVQGQKHQHAYHEPQLPTM